MAKLKKSPPNKLRLLKAAKVAAGQIRLRESDRFRKVEERLESGQFAEAKILLDNLRAEQPDSSLLTAHLGTVAHGLGRPDKAEEYFRQALKIEPRNAEALAGLGILALERGDLNPAARFFNRALQSAPEHYQALNGFGRLYLMSRDPARARACFTRALAIRPQAAESLFLLGLANANLGNPQEAEINYRLATIAKPDHAGAFNNWGVIQAAKGSFAEAEVSYRRSLEITPDNIHALFNLAELYEKTSQLQEAEQLVRKALTLAPDEPGCRRLMATLLRRRGQVREALNILEKIAVPDANLEKALEIDYELARIHERLGHYEKAYHYFSRTKKLQSLSLQARKFDKDNFLRGVAELESYFTEERLRRWGGVSRSALGGSRPPIFLVGFPRSGTTLLDQILDSHPDFKVVEECAALDLVIARLRGLKGGYPGDLEQLTPDTLEELRRQYLDNLSRFAGPESSGLRLIDKYPLHLMHLGLIQRLFPEARIILAIRHPYDVCLSNFMQLFSLNDAMANFLTLEDAAVCYDRVMRLGLRYLELLPLSVHRIRYEDLVEDLAAVGKGLLAFLEAEWDEKVTRFHEHARGRGKIATPSYQQVTEPIYRRARFRFRHYAPRFAACRHLLQPYLSRFGYPEIDPAVGVEPKAAGPAGSQATPD